MQFENNGLIALRNKSIIIIIVKFSNKFKYLLNVQIT